MTSLSANTVHPGRENNFDALRLFAAFMVIYGHGYALSTGTGPGFWGVPFARVGLDIFFSVSGYLVTKSWDGAPSLPLFLGKRARRILPGLVVCVLATTFLLGPLATSLPLGSYLGHAQTWSYLWNAVMYLHLSLPGVFTRLRDQGAVNGSLWSLAPEVFCYLTVPVFARLAPGPRPWLLLLAAILCGGIGTYLFEMPHAPAPAVFHIDLKYMLVEMPFFFMGGAYSLLERRSPHFYRGDLALLALTANFSVSSWFDWWSWPLEWVTLPYVVITFGRLSLPLLNRAGRFGDLSYGTYLYAFPIQQGLLYAFPGLAFPIFTCSLVTLGAAFLSWHAVEGPALRWGVHIKEKKQVSSFSEEKEAKRLLF